MARSKLSSGHLVRFVEAVVCLSAVPPIQLSVSVGSRLILLTGAVSSALQSSVIKGRDTHADMITGRHDQT